MSHCSFVDGATLVFEISRASDPGIGKILQGADFTIILHQNGTILWYNS